MAVGDQSEISVSIPQGMLPWQPSDFNFEPWIHRFRLWTARWHEKL